MLRPVAQPSRTTAASHGTAHGVRAASHVVRYRRGRDAEAASSSRPTPTAIPAASQLQASLMLVPKPQRSTGQALQRLPSAADGTLDGLQGLLTKCRLAWNLFFPPEPDSAPALSPSELGKQRLSMMLVADRCGMSPRSIVAMKQRTLSGLQDVMALDDLQDASLRFTMTREGGVTYSMAVPILREGPYAADGSVVGQQPPGAAAAAAAGLDASWEEEEGDDYGDEFEEEGKGALWSADASYELAAEWAEGGDALPDDEQEEAEQEAVADAAVAPAEAGRAATGAAAARGPQVLSRAQLKALLVEELVHDVEDLVGSQRPVVRHEAPSSSHEGVDSTSSSC